MAATLATFLGPADRYGKSTDPSDSRTYRFLFSNFIFLATSWVVYLCRLYTRS